LEYLFSIFLVAMCSISLHVLVTTNVDSVELVTPNLVAKAKMFDEGQEIARMYPCEEQIIRLAEWQERADILSDSQSSETAHPVKEMGVLRVVS